MTAKEFTEAAIAVFLERGGKLTPDITLDIMLLIEKDERLFGLYSAISKKERDEFNKGIGKYIKKHFGLEDDKKNVPTNGKTELMKSYTRFKVVQTTNVNPSTMQTEYRMPDPIVKTAKKLLDNAGQIILQGAPGCGKTYITTELAVYLCDGQVPASRAALKARYKELEAEGRIGFTTFHQSLDYEEFVEGMKPDTG